MIDLDLTTKEGELEAKEKIKNALFSFKTEDKNFLKTLLFLLLKTISNHEERIQELEFQIVNLLKEKENVQQ